MRRRRRPSSRVGKVRKFWHEKRGHPVVRSVGRDVRWVHGAYQFYYRPVWLCVVCRSEWKW